MKKLKTYFIYFRDIFLLQWGTVKINCREHTPCHPEVETCLNRTFLKSSWLKWKHKTDSAVHSSQDMAHSTWSLVQPSKRKKEHFVIVIRAQIGAASWLLLPPPPKNITLPELSGINTKTDTKQMNHKNVIYLYCKIGKGMWVVHSSNNINWWIHLQQAVNSDRPHKHTILGMLWPNLTDFTIHRHWQCKSPAGCTD